MSTDGTPFPIEGIRVVLLEGLPERLATQVLARLSRRVRVPCRVAASPGGIEPRALPGREQVDADHLLAQLESAEIPEGEILLALTGLDLGNPVFTFFFGRARRGGRAALVSLARLSPSFYGLPEDEGATARRAVLEILHEIGHLAGLAHCESWTCLMHFCTDVTAIDNRGTTFCEACSAALPEAFDGLTQR